MSTTQRATGAPEAKQRTGSRLFPILVAVAGTVAVWLIATAAFNVELKAKTGDTVTTVTLPSVIVTTLVMGLLAWALLAVLERVTGSARAVWTTIAVVVFVFSLLLGPAAGVGTAAKFTLVCLHLVPALVIIPGLARTARRR